MDGINMFDNIVDISTIITNLFLAVGVIIAVFQLIQMKKSNLLQTQSMMADHERRKKQSTLEFYTNIYPHLRKLRTKITDTFGNEYITPNDSRYSKDITIQKTVYEYLVVIERFAVGVNTGIYDINIFANTSGKVVADMYKKLSPIIEEMRLIQNYPEMFGDFEKMSKEVEKIRNKMQLEITNTDSAEIKYISFGD